MKARHSTYLLVTLAACGAGEQLEAPADGTTTGAIQESSDVSVGVDTSGSEAGDGTSGSEGGASPDFVPDPTWQRREVRFPDYEVPAERTTYACASTTFELDALEHVVAFEAVIDNPDLVHHMILGVGPSSIDGTEPCYPSSPGVVMQWGWAPGIQPLALPEDAGIPIGNAPAGKVHYVLQIHYENAKERQGQLDRTGVNVYTTRDLRQHQASTLSIGDVAGLAIPAGQDAFETIHYCPGETTSKFLPEPLRVYGSWLHAHRLGKALWTEQRRGGETIAELGRHDPYDFGLQYLEPLDAVIEPGDELVTHCVYDSSERDQPTLGGDGSDDEMCLNYLFYYPALPYPFHCNE